MSTLSRAPTVNVKPVIGGVEMAVRYIARASERYLMRSNLYEVAIKLIGKKDVEVPPLK